MRSNSNQKAKVRGPRQNLRKQQGPARRSAATGPTQLSTNVRLKHKFRFLASAAFAGGVTDTALLGACGGICTVTNSTIALLAKSVKVRSIEIWSAPSAQGAGATCSVDWEGFGNSPNVEISDTTLSVSKNAHVRSSPPSQSLCAFWQTNTGTNLFNLVCPINSIVDVEVDVVLADTSGSVIIITSVTTGVLSHIYFLALDGRASNLLVPVSLNTTS